MKDRDFLLGKIDLVHKNSILKILKCFPFVQFPSPSTSHCQQDSFIHSFIGFMRQVSHITQAGLELTVYPGLAQTHGNPLVLAASVLRLQE